ncbi:MAG: hypothetical protein QOE53_751, partial [Pseudonocardiales bacterium]|nr:hypothetical protein [Pseudonocardiales bacterium]
MSTDSSRAGVIPGRVFISYAHDSDEHEERVRAFWLFLRGLGIDAKLDRPAAARRQDWPLWMTRQVREAEFILVIASPAYRRRAEGDAAFDEGRGVQYEAALLRELVYRDRGGSLDIILPVVLPGCDATDIPIWLNPISTTHYVVADLTVAGSEQLLRTLVGEPEPSQVEPPLGPRISFASGNPPGNAQVDLSGRALSTLVEVELGMADGELVSTVLVAETPVSTYRHRLPNSVRDVWQALSFSQSVAESRIVSTGNDLAEAVFDEGTRRLLGSLADSLAPGSRVEIRFDCDQVTQNLPLELIRLTDRHGVDLGPIALQPGLSVYRTIRDHHAVPTKPSAGPVKVLVAVAAPDETKTANPSLDVEAEMQAVLEATKSLAEQPTAEVQILEVASLDQITAALRDQEFHVLHLSAHGNPEGVELEDEDGYPVPVSARELMGALRDADQAVPVIVLSSCAGAAAASDGDSLASALIRSGADRVIAMQAPVTDRYATELAAAFYTELAARPWQPVAAALAIARRNSERQRQQRARAASVGTSTASDKRPQYAVATIYAASADAPLTDPKLPQRPLAHPTPMPSGLSVRELSIGRHIGRRTQLRTATTVLRRTPQAVERYGTGAGVVLTGIGGIGKTALAGRLISRLRNDGYPV